MLNEVHQLLTIYLTVPTTTATAERTFLILAYARTIIAAPPPNLKYIPLPLLLGLGERGFSNNL